MKKVNLIEWTVVTIVIGILGTLIIERISRPSNPGGHRFEEDLKGIVRGAEEFFLENARYPENLDELTDWESRKPRVMRWVTYFMDPWGNRIVYELRDGKPRAISYGLDGKPGGTGADADLEWPPPRTTQWE